VSRLGSQSVATRGFHLIKESAASAANAAAAALRSHAALSQFHYFSSLMKF